MTNDESDYTAYCVHFSSHAQVRLLVQSVSSLTFVLARTYAHYTTTFSSLIQPRLRVGCRILPSSNSTLNAMMYCACDRLSLQSSARHFLYASGSTDIILCEQICIDPFPRTIISTEHIYQVCLCSLKICPRHSRFLPSALTCLDLKQLLTSMFLTVLLISRLNTDSYISHSTGFPGEDFAAPYFV
jgi:hypothetical protein